jgi:hypothetical protein
MSRMKWQSYQAGAAVGCFGVSCVFCGGRLSGDDGRFACVSTSWCINSMDVFVKGMQAVPATNAR